MFATAIANHQYVHRSATFYVNNSNPRGKFGPPIALNNAQQAAELWYELGLVSTRGPGAALVVGTRNNAASE